MKTIKFISIIIAFILVSINVNAQCDHAKSNVKSDNNSIQQENNSSNLITDTFKVYGVCEMCKDRIEKAAKVKGVTFANWDSQTQILKITYNPDVISLNDIKNKIVSVGHDTDKLKATDKAYNALPKCCQYVREK